MLYPTKVGNVKGINLPHMPASDSDYLTLTSGATSPIAGTCCAIENTPTTIHALRTSAASGITVGCLMLKSDGTVENVSLAISNNNVWVTKTFDSQNIVACICSYNGSLGSGQIHVYFT